MLDFQELCRNTSSRRAFLARMAAAGLGAAALGLFDARSAQATGKKLLDTVTTPDNEHFPGIPGRTMNERVLNYALTLETLEADLYRQALNLASGKDIGTPLPEDVSGYTLSIPTGYLPPPHPQIGFTYLQQFAAVEAAHRDFLRGALKLDGIILGLGIHPKKYQFGVESMSREQILAMLIDVEAAGTMAYLGAIPFFRTKIFLTTAAGILGTEARRTAALQSIQNRLLMDKLIADGTPAPPAPLATTNHGIDTSMDPDAVLAKVSPFIVG